jgi:LPXTG-site transpeptidase (sortase) family protein
MGEMVRSKLQFVRILVAVAALASLLIYSGEAAAGYFAGFIKSHQTGGYDTFEKQFAPGEVNQDLSIQKSHTGDFTIGETGAYIIEVTNQGPEASEGTITVTDTLPDGLSPSQVSGEGWESCGFAGQVVTCVYSSTASLPPQGVLSPIILEVNVAEEAAPVITNTVTMANDNDPDVDNNTASDRTTIVSADLAVSKSVTPLFPAEGDQVIFTVNVTNNGPSLTSGVVLTDTLPPGLILTSASPSTGTYDSGLWSIGDMQVGQIDTLILNAEVDQNTRGQWITNTANGLSSSLYDYDTTNNSGSATIRVQSTSLFGIVTDIVTDLPVEDATAVLTDSSDRVYTTQTSASGWYTFTETVSNPIAPGIADVTVSKEGYAPKSLTIDIQSSIDNFLDFELDTVDLRVDKSDGQSKVIPGEEITYTLTITNAGSITATQVIITDVLSSDMTYITDTLGISADEPTDGTFVWELDDPLAPNTSLSFDLGAQVAWALPSPTAPVENIISVSTNSPEANLDNNSDEDVNNATGTPDIEIVKSVNPNQVRRGQSLIYTIRVSNDGTAAVTDVEVRDTFSSYLNLTSATTSKGTAVRNTTTRTVTVTIPVLDVDETVTIRVYATVNTLATTNFTVSNRTDLTYTFGGDDKDIESNSVSLRILGTSTLPGTGGIELQDTQEGVSTWAFTIALLSSILLAAFAILAFAGGFWAKKWGSDWTSWLLKMGAILTVAAIIFGLAGWALREKPETVEPSVSFVGPADPWVESDEVQDDIPDEPEFSLDVADYYVSEPETLPDYPIPTPTIEVLDEGEPPPDISPVERIVLPSIGVDTVVKFVPYDGFTWLIGGLKQEVAWMGNTSWPGLGGNTALAGHVTLREGGDGPFRNLVNLNEGDQVYLYTQEKLYVYQVKDQRVVGETEVSVLARGQDSRITLITCTSWDEDAELYTDRLVVRADLVKVESFYGGEQSTLSGSSQLSD